MLHASVSAFAFLAHFAPDRHLTMLVMDEQCNAGHFVIG
jgi:hypothetical protein